MIDQYYIEALENIYNIDTFASHYDFIVPKLEKVKVQSNKKTKPRVQSVCKTQKRKDFKNQRHGTIQKKLEQYNLLLLFGLIQFGFQFF